MYSTIDSAFTKHLTGLFKVDEGGSTPKDALAYFNLNNEHSKLTFYFRVKKNGVVDTVSTDFDLYITSAYTAYSANIIKRTPAYGYAGLSLSTGVIDADKIYIQSSPGSYALLRVPGLSGLDNRLIHRAEISFQPLDLPVMIFIRSESAVC